MKRKKFLKVAGASAAGIAVFNQIPVSLLADSMESKGAAMIEIKTKRLFLEHTWTISRNSSDYKDNVFVKIEKDGIAGYGEAGPNVRYGEDAEKTTNRIMGIKDMVEQYNLWHFVDLKNEIFQILHLHLFL